MAYYSENELCKLGFASLGLNVKISKKASLYDCEKIKIGNNSRIDDFCVISGNIVIGCNVHITPQCLIAGGQLGITLEDFTTFAYQVKIFSQSDDYSGKTMTNSTIPKKYKNEIIKSVTVKRFSIVGAGATIMPGVTLAEGTAIGSMALVTKTTEPWSIYAGVPAHKIKDRNKELLNYYKEFINDKN